MEDDEVISERDDVYLVQATLRGEEEAFSELARRYRKLAFGVAFNRLGDYDAALDASQDALVAAFMQLPTLRDPGRFASWLCRIAGNIALVRLRGRRETYSLDSVAVAEVPSAGVSPEAAADRLSERDALDKALARLPDDDRLAVILHYVSGHSHEEIADMLGASASSVKSRLYRARRRLREEILDAMQTMGEQLPEAEVTEELLERLLWKADIPEFGVVAHLGGSPGALAGMMPLFTRNTKEAIPRLAARLSGEGCRRLYAPVWLPDGPGVDLFRSLGFETETEIAVYERDLTARLPTIPPLPAGFTVRPLADVPAADLLELVTAPMRRADPDLIRRKCAPDPDQLTEEWAERFMEDPHTVREASLAAYYGGRPVAALKALGIASWEIWLYEPGTSLFVPYFDTDADLEAAMPHLVGASLKALKKAGFKSSAVDLSLNSDSPWRPLLQRLGFRHVRSLWNLRLELRHDG